MLPAASLLLTLALTLAQPSPEPAPQPPPQPPELALAASPDAEPRTRLQLLVGLASIGLGLEHRLTDRDFLVAEVAGGLRLGLALVAGGPADGPPRLSVDVVRLGLAWRRSSQNRRAYLDVGVQVSSFGVGTSDGGMGGSFAGVYFQPNVGGGRVRFAPTFGGGILGAEGTQSFVAFVVPVGLIISL